MLTTLAALGGAIAFLQVREPVYEATANILVNPLPQDDQTFLGLELLRDSGDPTRTVQTAAALLESEEAAELTAKRVKGFTPKQVVDNVDVDPQGESNIIAITATAETPRLAAQLADEFARSALAIRERELNEQVGAAITRAEAELAKADPLSQTATDLSVRLNQLRAVADAGDPTLTFSQPASLPRSASTTGPFVLIPLALFAGFALGSGAALLRKLFDRSIVGVDEAVEAYPVPVLARVPLLSKREMRGPPEVTWYMPPAIREPFRSIVVQLDKQGREHGALMVTSASSGDGKTTSSINLAVATAATGRSVVLMDFDLRKPDIGRLLRIEEPAGVAQLIDSSSNLDDLLVAVPNLPNLSVLPMRTVAGDFALVEAMNHRLPQLVEQARATGAYVVIDTPPLGEVSDALRVVHTVDDVLVVARAGHTDRSRLVGVRDLLERSGRTPTGMIMLDAGEHRGSAYYGYGVQQRDLSALTAAPRASAPERQPG